MAAPTFADLKFRFRGFGFNSIRARIAFPNGYGASVVKGAGSYGADAVLYELAVMRDDGLCYSTPITDDVCGYLTEADVTRLLGEIAALPAKAAA